MAVFMRRIIGIVVVAAVICGIAPTAQADDELVSIAMLQKSVAMDFGQPVIAEAVVTPASTTRPTDISWVSSDPSIFAPSYRGWSEGGRELNRLQGPLKRGTVTITVTARRGDKVVSDTFTVTIGPIVPEQEPGTFVPITPTRALDTRGGGGEPPRVVGPNSEFTLPLGQVHGVPATGVSAVVLNVVARSARSGFLTLFPAGGPVPNASSINFTGGHPEVANAVVVAVDPSVSIGVRNASLAPTMIIVDVTGYYLGGSATAPGTYQPVAPTRLIDTRESVRVPAGGDVLVPIVGRAGVPNGTAAAVVNVTAIASEAPGFVTAFPDGSPRPTASNMNFLTGQIVANVATVKLGPSGGIRIFNAAATPIDIVVDLAGSYRGGQATATGAFVALEPTRIVDTRLRFGYFLPGESRAIAIAGRVGIPATTRAAVLNVTAVDAATYGWLALFPTGEPFKMTSTLNYSQNGYNWGGTIANQATAPLGRDGTTTVTNGSQGIVHLVIDAQGYFVG